MYLYVYTQLFLSPGSVINQLTSDWKHLKKVTFVADVYCVVRPRMVAAARNMCKIFFLLLFPKQ